MSITLYHDEKALAVLTLVGKKLHVGDLAGGGGRYTLEAMRGAMGADLTDEELYRALPFLARGHTQVTISPPDEREHLLDWSYIKSLEQAVKTRPPCKTYSIDEEHPYEASIWAKAVTMLKRGAAAGPFDEMTRAQPWPSAYMTLWTVYGGHGELEPQDVAKGVEWFHVAAERGQAGAQYSLGIMYADGLVVPQDYVQAYKWLSLAASPSPPPGGTRFPIVTSSLPK